MQTIQESTPFFFPTRWISRIKGLVRDHYEGRALKEPLMSREDALEKLSKRIEGEVIARHWVERSVALMNVTWQALEAKSKRTGEPKTIGALLGLLSISRLDQFCRSYKATPEASAVQKYLDHLPGYKKDGRSFDATHELHNALITLILVDVAPNFKWNPDTKMAEFA